jgi:hypothetical protein
MGRGARTDGVHAPGSDAIEGGSGRALSAGTTTVDGVLAAGGVPHARSANPDARTRRRDMPGDSS